MVRIYLDLETYRPKKENAFIDEKIILAGMVIDETSYNENSLRQKIDPIYISEWNGFNECQIVAKVQEIIKEAQATHNFTVLSGYGMNRKCMKHSNNSLKRMARRQLTTEKL